MVSQHLVGQALIDKATSTSFTQANLVRGLSIANDLDEQNMLSVCLGLNDQRLDLLDENVTKACHAIAVALSALSSASQEL